MRVLFTCRPLTGHFEPLVPIARATADAGHEVAFAAGEPILGAARKRGFEAFAAGPGGELREQWLHRIPANPGREWFFTEIFAKLELPLRAPELRAVVERWRPDVLVHDFAELAGPLVASERDIPYATAGVGVLPTKEVLEATAEAAGGWAPYAGLYRHLYLDVCPPSLQLPWVEELPVQRVRPLDVETLPKPPWLREHSVYLTLGTVWNREATVFQEVLAALGDVNVVVTTGRELDLGPQPSNVHVERFVPQAAILPHVDAVVCHGGAGTVLGALAYGRPLVVVPQGADQFVNAERVVAAGAGLRWPAAVRTVLDDPAYASAARRIAEEIAAMPRVELAVEALSAL